MISFVVPGEPVPWARARRQGRRYFTDPVVAARKRVVAHAAYEEMRGVAKALKGEAVEIEIQFVFSGKKGGPHARRPDLDNLVKLVLDAMNDVVYEDDGCVASIRASKATLVDTEPQTIIRVDRWGERF